MRKNRHRRFDTHGHDKLSDSGKSMTRQSEARRVRSDVDYIENKMDNLRSRIRNLTVPRVRSITIDGIWIPLTRTMHTVQRLLAQPPRVGPRGKRLEAPVEDRAYLRTGLVLRNFLQSRVGSTLRTEASNTLKKADFQMIGDKIRNLVQKRMQSWTHIEGNQK